MKSVQKIVKKINSGIVMILLASAYFFGIGLSKIIFILVRKQNRSTNTYWIRAYKDDDVRYDSAY